MALQALQQLTGVNFIFYYGTSYFANSGIDNPFIVSMITSVVNVCSTIPGLWLVEVWGRRSLLLFGAIGKLSLIHKYMFLSQADTERYECLSNYRCICWNSLARLDCGQQDVDCICLHIYLLFCLFVGPMRVGGHRRIVPIESSSQRLINDDGFKLATQLYYSLLHAVHGRCWTGQCRPWQQGLLRLGRFLCYLHSFRVLLHL